MSSDCGVFRWSGTEFQIRGKAEQKVWSPMVRILIQGWRRTLMLWDWLSKRWGGPLDNQGLWHEYTVRWRWFSCFSVDILRGLSHLPPHHFRAETIDKRWGDSIWGSCLPILSDNSQSLTIWEQFYSLTTACLADYFHGTCVFMMRADGKPDIHCASSHVLLSSQVTLKESCELRCQTFHFPWAAESASLVWCWHRK